MALFDVYFLAGDSGVRIGLLEDDASQIELIDLWTSESGDELEYFTNGKHFREAIRQQDFDVLVLDWHLPDTTGIQELDWLRGHSAIRTPVLFITSRDSEASVVEALEHGADDYMVKPVTRAVTLARLRALQRRHRQMPGDSFNAGNEQHDGLDQAGFPPYQINDVQQSIALNGEAIKLTTREFELAAYLFRREGSLVSRRELMTAVWGTTAELNTRTVDTHISRVRSKLRISPASGWQLSSIYQRGYRLFRVSDE